MRLSNALCSAAAFSAALLLAGPASARVTGFFEDFESLDRTDPNALADTGWLLFASGVNGDVAFPDFGVGPFDAPNNIDNPNITVISDFPSGGDPPEGNQGLVVFTDTQSPLFNDVEDVDPRDLVISVFQQRTITEADLDNSITFNWLAEGNSFFPNGDAFTEAFLLTLDPMANFSATNNLFVDTTTVPDGDPTPGSLSLDLFDPALIGQILQFGFRVTASDFEDSAVDYDNVSLVVTGPGLAGDLNGDNAVNAGDYTIFRDGASLNGLGTTTDFDAFVANFDGASTVGAATASFAIPEPGAALLLIPAAGAWAFRRVRAVVRRGHGCTAQQI